MAYIDPKTGQTVTLSGSLGEQNLAANRAGYDYRPDAPVTAPVATTTPASTGPTPEQTANASRDAGLTPEQKAGVATGAGYDATIANSGVRRYPGDTPTSGTYDTEAQRLATLANAPVQDEATIRQKMRENVQGQIDAIKNTFAGLLSADVVAGQGRLGATRAAGARSGTLGQDFGNAEMANTEKLNAEQQAAIANQRDLKIETILGNIDNEAYNRAQNATIQAGQNSEKYLAYLKDARDQSRTDALNLAKSGADLSQLTDVQYKKLLDASGYTPEQMKALFITNKPEDKVLTSFTQGNQYIVVTQDPITGVRKTEKVDMGFTVPTDWKDTKLDDGSILFYDPKDPTKQSIYHPAGQSLAQQKTALEIQKLKQDINGANNLSTADLKNLKAGGIPEDVATGVFKDASNGYSDAAIQKQLTDTFGGELGAQYWTAFTNTMRKSQTANAALLTALGIHP